MPAFPNINIGEGSSRTKKHRVITTNFGDGYSQAVGDGLNVEQEEWDLVFTNYLESDVNTLISFFDSLASVQSFDWTPPFETISKKWRQDGEYNVSFNGPISRTFSVKIKRVYI